MTEVQLTCLVKPLRQQAGSHRFKAHHDSVGASLLAKEVAMVAMWTCFIADKLAPTSVRANEVMALNL